MTGHDVRLTHVVVRAMCVAGLLGAAIGASGQENATQPKAGVPIEKPKIVPPQDITATGCLARDADRFLLKDAAVEIKPWVAPTVHGAGPGSPKPSASQTVFALRNPQGLEQHVGHRIEVRGVVARVVASIATHIRPRWWARTTSVIMPSCVCRHVHKTRLSRSTRNAK